MEIFKLIGKIIIENNEAIDGLEDTAREANEVGQAFEKADRKAEKLSGGFTVLKGVASNLITEGFQRLCSAIGDFVSDGYDYSRQIENYAASFEVMTGSEEKAIEVTQRLQEIGASTPFELPQLADTTQLLMNYGFTADEAIEKMTMLGDISQGSSEKMGRIASAYGQMSSAGKVSLEDIKQMIEAGFNPLQEISESTGETMESLYDRISKGTISVDEITASMVRSTSEGGKYFGSMEMHSETLDGRLSTLKDTANESIGNILTPLLQRLADEWLPNVTDAISTVDEKFTAVGNWISEHQGLFVALGAVIGVVTTALTAQSVVQAVQIAMNAAEVTSLGALISAKAASAAATLAALAPYLLITAAIAAVIAIIVLCVQHWDEIKAKTIEVATAMAEKWQEIKEAVSNRVSEMVSNAVGKFNEMKSNVVAKFDEIKSNIQEKIESARDIVQKAIEKIRSFLNFSWELPKLKMPHFTISGKFSLNPPSVPSFGISWYKKAYDEAMVLNDPTIFGYSPATGKMLGGGEGNGNEVVAGETHLMNMIQEAVAVQNETMIFYLQSLVDMLAEYFPQVIEAAGHDIVTNDGVIVARYAPMFNTALGKISKGKDRGR